MSTSSSSTSRHTSRAASGRGFDVCVRGAGAVGSTLALALSAGGLRVALVDAAPLRAAGGEDLRTFALNARAVALLQQLRVWDALPPDAACRVNRMRVHGDAGGHLDFSAWQQCEAEIAWIVDAAALELSRAGVAPRIMIDSSHANSSKKPENQPLVVADIAGQLAGGEQRITGVMIESNLVAGRQDVVPGKPLTHGQSITDGCIDWETTVSALNSLANAVSARRNVRSRKLQERSA